MTISDPRRRLLSAGASLAAAAITSPASWAQAPAAKPPILVLNSQDADVSLIDPTSLAVIGKTPVGKEPHHLYPTPDNRYVVVGNAVSDSLTLLDPMTGKFAMQIPGVADPYHLGFSPDQNFFVTCANRLDHVDVYRRVGDGQQMKLQGLRRFDLAKTPSHLVFHHDSSVAYCTLQESDELVALDLRKLAVMWRFKVGRLPAGVAISPDSSLLFVGVMGANSVQVIDPAAGPQKMPKLVANISTGEGAHAFRNQGNRRHLWVSNRMANTISRLDMGTLKIDAEIKVPGGPDCMDIDQSGKQLWVTQRWLRAVSLVDLDQGKVTKRITVGRSPHGVYVHDRAGLL